MLDFQQTEPCATARAGQAPRHPCVQVRRADPGPGIRPRLLFPGTLRDPPDHPINDRRGREVRIVDQHRPTPSTPSRPLSCGAYLQFGFAAPETSGLAFPSAGRAKASDGSMAGTFQEQTSGTGSPAVPFAKMSSKDSNLSGLVDHLRLRVFGPDIGHVQRHVGQPHAQFEGQLLHGIGREDRPDGRRSRAVKPGDRLAVKGNRRTQPGLSGVRGPR